MKTKSSGSVGVSLINHVVQANYIDSCSCPRPPGWNRPPDDLAVDFWTVAPRWVGALMRLRNILVRPFGLKGGAQDAEAWERAIREGGAAGFMSVAAKSPSETIVRLSDSHLDAWLSVMFDGDRIHAITAVKYNNRLGRVYFALIRPFHKLVVRSMLGGAVGRLAACSEKDQ